MESKAKRRMKIFSLNSNRALAEKIANEVGIPLGKATIKQFSDGEIQVNIEESIRGAEVYVIQSISDPINDSLMELLIMVDALRRASARQINVVILTTAIPSRSQGSFTGTHYGKINC